MRSVKNESNTTSVKKRDQKLWGFNILFQYHQSQFSTGDFIRRLSLAPWTIGVLNELCWRDNLSSPAVYYKERATPAWAQKGFLYIQHAVVSLKEVLNTTSSTSQRNSPIGQRKKRTWRACFMRNDLFREQPSFRQFSHRSYFVDRLQHLFFLVGPRRLSSLLSWKTSFEVLRKQCDLDRLLDSYVRLDCGGPLV